MKQTGILIFVWLSLASSMELLAGDSAHDAATLKAFGGTIRIPSSMEVSVSNLADGSFEIRMRTKNTDQEGIITIIIKRPRARTDEDTDDLVQIGDYQLNDFRVILYRLDPKKWHSGLMAARVERCDDIGQIITTSRESLNDYLNSASDWDCQ